MLRILIKKYLKRIHAKVQKLKLLEPTLNLQQVNTRLLSLLGIKLDGHDFKSKFSKILIFIFIKYIFICLGTSDSFHLD